MLVTLVEIITADAELGLHGEFAYRFAIQLIWLTDDVHVVDKTEQGRVERDMN